LLGLAKRRILSILIGNRDSLWDYKSIKWLILSILIILVTRNKGKLCSILFR
jgi:hypothetical protein